MSRSLMQSTVLVEILEMSLLIASMLLGWFVWSSAIHVMSRQELAAEALPNPKEVHVDAESSDEDGAELRETLETPIRPYDEQVRSLFESYGVFGASTSSAEDALSELCDMDADGECDREGLESDEESDSDVLFQQSSSHTRTPLDALFEHYSLFEARPGLWCPAAIEDDHDSVAESDDIADSCDESVLATSRTDVASMLLEHYGLFSASPGTWSRTSKCTLSDTDDLEVPGCTLKEGGQQGRAAALFEQYCLFGAEPGTWSKDSDVSTMCSESESAESLEKAASDINSETDA